MEAKLSRDGAELPVLAVVEAPDLGALRGRDHRPSSCERRWAPASGPATGSAGRRPRTAWAQPPGPARGRRPDGESVRWPGCGGSVIRHAAPGAVGALPVAVVEAPLGTALMVGPGGSDRPAASGRAAPRRAVGMAAVTCRTDGEGPAALTTGLLAEGLFHGVGARGAVSDWTTGLNRGKTAGTGSVCRSSGRSRGPGRHNRALTPRLSPLSTLSERRADRQRRGRGRRRSPWTQRARPQELGKPRRTAVSHSAHSRHLRIIKIHTRRPVPGRARQASVENSSVFRDS